MDLGQGATSAAKVEAVDMPNYSDYYVDSSGYERDFRERIDDWLTGRDYSARYESDFNLNNMKYQEAYNKYLDYREDTKTQRLVNDLKAAGLNPWLAVQSGFTSSGASAASPSTTSAAKFSKKDSMFSIFSNLIGTVAKIALFGSVLGSYASSEASEVVDTFNKSGELVKKTVKRRK